MSARAARWLLPALACAALALAAAPAGAAIPDFGPAPHKCGGGVYYGPSGCYGIDSGPGAMDDGNTFNLNVSPHIVHPGQTLTATMTALPGAMFTWPAAVGGLTQVGLCASGAQTCSYLAGGAGDTQWQKFSMTCCGAIEQDYFAVLGEGWSIDGTVKNRTPAGLVVAPNVQVTMTGPAGTFTTTTNPAGDFQRNVPAGAYTVQTGERHCVKAQLPQCVTSKQVTVGPDAHIDFEQPSDVVISGTVKDEEGGAVSPVRIIAKDPATGDRLGSSISDPNGIYKIKLRAGAVFLMSDNTDACVVSAGDECPANKEFDVSRDTTVDWKVKGCVKKVDFGSSMIAVDGCFTKVEDDVWETEKTFLMNGIRVLPAGKVVLDRAAQTVTFKSVVFKVFGIPFLAQPTLKLNFAAAKETLPNDEFTVKGIKIPEDSIVLTSEAGKSTFAIAAKVPLAFGNPDVSSGENACPGTTKVTLTAVFTNDNGPKSLGIAADDAAKEFCINGKAETPPGGSRGAVGAGAPGAGLRLEGVRGTYDLVTHYWTLGAKLSGLPSIGGKVTVDGEVTLDQDFWPSRFAVKLDNINKPLRPPDFFWQRVDMNVGNDAPNTPFKIGFGAGFSLFAKIPKEAQKKQRLPLLGEVTVIPSEIASLDGSLTVAAAPGASSVADIGLEGNMTLKIWDYPFLTAKVGYIGSSSSFTFDGRLGFVLPNGQFGLEGRATGFWDVSRSLLFAEGTANLRFPGLDPIAADVVANVKAGVLAACVVDPFSADPALNRFGVVYKFKEGISPVRGCDVSQYRETAPKAVGAARARSFTVRPKTGMLIAEVTGAKGANAPAVTVTGPRTTVTATAARGARKGPVIVLPTTGSNTTYVVLRHAPAGRWSITPAKGSVIRRVRFAGSLPAPSVSGRVTGAACSPKLRWSARRIPGQKLMIVDSGPAGDRRVLVASGGASGSVTIPRLATGGERTAQALVLNGDTVRATIPLVSYSAPGDAPGAPDGLRVSAGKGGKLLVRWRAACGAKRYAVVAGKAKATTVSGTSLSVKRPKGAAVVRVMSIGASGAQGGSAERPLAAG